jgi:hypothetical protein
MLEGRCALFIQMTKPLISNTSNPLTSLTSKFSNPLTSLKTSKKQGHSTFVEWPKPNENNLPTVNCQLLRAVMFLFCAIYTATSKKGHSIGSNF